MYTLFTNKNILPPDTQAHPHTPSQTQTLTRTHTHTYTHTHTHTHTLEQTWPNSFLIY